MYQLDGNVVSPGEGTSVPDAGGTLPLLGLAVAGLTWFRRRSFR